FSNYPIVTGMMAFGKNKTGKVNKEMVTGPRRHRLFDQADANKDGVVTKEELIALAAKLDAEYGPGGKGGFGKGKGGKGPKGKGGLGKGPPGKDAPDKGPPDKGPPDKGAIPGKGAGGGPGGGFGGPKGGPPQPGPIVRPIRRVRFHLREAQRGRCKRRHT